MVSGIGEVIFLPIRETSPSRATRARVTGLAIGEALDPARLDFRNNITAVAAALAKGQIRNRFDTRGFSAPGANLD